MRRSICEPSTLRSRNHRRFYHQARLHNDLAPRSNLRQSDAPLAHVSIATNFCRRRRRNEHFPSLGYRGQILFHEVSPQLHPIIRAELPPMFRVDANTGVRSAGQTDSGMSVAALSDSTIKRFRPFWQASLEANEALTCDVAPFLPGGRVSRTIRIVRQPRHSACKCLIELRRAGLDALRNGNTRRRVRVADSKEIHLVRG